MSVDTYLKGKKTGGYRRVHQDDVMVMIAPALMRYSNKVELVVKKNILMGKKLVALAYHEHTSSCNHPTDC